MALVSIVPRNVLMQESGKIIREMLIFYIIVCGISFVLLQLGTRPFLGRIRKLDTTMEAVDQGIMEPISVPEYRDELGRLTQRYNKMVEQIQHLLEEQYVLGKEKSEAQLYALQAQISPHFLYNTLDSIYWYSLSDRQRDIGNVVQHLAKMLRIALSKGSEYIPVERELQHVANYLEIESTIYQGRFTYEVEADPAVMSCTVLKILLQPLAENSITHGFANMERGGHIRVQVGQDADDLVLSVTDNGCGFPQEERTDAHTSEYSGFALKNLESRLQLHYGADARVLIHSIPTEKTTVTIKIRKSRVNSEDV